jgi:uncharacterized protein YecE (DUF72 family)
MRLFIGTSGYRYPDWEKGVFYPKGVGDRLAYLMERVNAIEINSSFYNIPKPAVVERWAQSVPEGARLVLKAPRSVSHRRRLKLESPEGVAQGRDLLLYFIEGCLQVPLAIRGPVLLQLPENIPIHLDRLNAVLALFGEHGLRVAVEIRHESWLVHEAYALLRRHGAALVATQWKFFTVPVIETTDFIYVRFHGPDPLHPYWGGYAEDDLQRFLDDILASGVAEAYVFFNNDYHAHAPRNAMTMLEMAGVTKNLQAGQ